MFVFVILIAYSCYILRVVALLQIWLSIRVREFVEKVLKFDIGGSLKVLEFEMSECL